MKADAGEERERNLLGWLGWLVVVLVIFGTFVWWWPRNEAALARAMMLQAGAQLPVQINLARGQWLLDGRPRPLQWHMAGKDTAQTELTEPLWFAGDGGLLLLPQQDCRRLWRVLLQRPLQVRNQVLRVEQGEDENGALCVYAAAGVTLRWWPRAHRVLVLTDPAD